MSATVSFADWLSNFVPRTYRDKTVCKYLAALENSDCKIIKCDVVENAIRYAMEEWLDAYMIQIESN